MSEINEIDGIDYVICGICGKKQLQITAAHLKTHNVTFEQYLNMFPDRLWRSEKLQTEQTKNQIKVQYNNEKNKCKFCNKSIKWNQTFCSIKCAAEFRKSPLVSINCYECGKQFYTNPNNKQKFCSQECYINSKKRQSIDHKRENVKNREGFQCTLCKSYQNLRIHHIDENNKNNDEDNLILLCEKCRRIIHYGLKMTIYKKITIEIAHQLPKHVSCKFLHGHSMNITIGIKGKVNLKTGMVMDFKSLKSFLQSIIIDKFDHSYLNDILPNPTAELFAFYIFKKLREVNINVVLVRIYETKNNFVEFKKDEEEENK